MPKKPTYRARHARYEIDRCEPQRSAIESGKIDFHALTKGHYPGTRIPNTVLPGLTSIGFWDAAGKPDWGLDAHRNKGVEICFLETGGMDFSVDQHNYKLRAGQFTITRPWQLHRLGAPHIGPGRLHWVILDVGVRRPHQPWRWPNWNVLTPKDLAELTDKLRHSDNPIWPATPAITHSFRELAKNVTAWDRPHSVSRLAANLNQLLIGILDVLGSQPAREDKQLVSRRQTVQIFLEDLENGRLNLGDAWAFSKMADHCDMGVTAFSQHTRALVNAGPVEFLNNCRLDKAARLLRGPEKCSVTEVALTCGFNSSQYFATHFKRKFKSSPSKFK